MPFGARGDAMPGSRFLLVVLNAIAILFSLQGEAQGSRAATAPDYVQSVYPFLGVDCCHHFRYLF